MTFAAFTLPLSVTVFPVRLPTISAAIVFGRVELPTPVRSAPLPLKYAAVALPVSRNSVVVRRPLASHEWSMLAPGTPATYCSE